MQVKQTHECCTVILQLVGLLTLACYSFRIIYVERKQGEVMKVMFKWF